MKYNKLIALALLTTSAQQIQLENHGIFDRFVKKMGEKEKAQQEADAIHEANVAKAEAEAARIAAADGLMSDSTPEIEQFARVQPKASAVQSVTQVAKTYRLQQKAAKLVEEEEDRDDFEGFGSITAMAQHKDALVDKTLEDPVFRAQLAAEE